jgi:hypothetical protein
MIHPVDYGPSQDYGDNPTKNLPASSWIIQQFGNYQPDGHTGTDYPCPVGTPVRAATDGVVLHVGRLGGTYADNPWWIAPSFAGYTYVVDHGHFIGIYGHCMDGGAKVTKGQRVTEGQVLGLSGNTGASTGPHLHFEALPDGYVLNSYMYGRINPATLFGTVTAQGEISVQATTTPKEWDEMASAEEIRTIVREESGNFWFTNAYGTPVQLWSILRAIDLNVNGNNENTQGKLDRLVGEAVGLRAAVAALATGSNVTPEQVERAIKEALTGFSITLTSAEGK